MNDTLNEAATPDPGALAAALAQEHAADIVERLNAESPETSSAVLLALPLERAAEVLDEPGLENAAALVEAQPRERAVALLKAMSADRAADVFRHLEPAAREPLLARLDPETRTSLAQLLAYPENTAGSIMTTEFVSVPSTLTIGETLQHIRKVERTRETIYAIYVVDPKTKVLLKAVSLRRLMTGAAEDPVLSVALPRRPITVRPLTDREDVGRLISKYDLLAVPVVDRYGHVLGIVTVDDVIDAMIEETTEDVQKFGGVEALDAPYMEIGFLQMIQKRAGWLCALFLGEMLTASAMQHFESELEKAVVLTLFIPLIMSSGGNSGSQATSLIIRAIALQEVQLRDWWRVALRELPTGLMLGSILGLIGIVRITLWQKARRVRLRRALGAGCLHGRRRPCRHCHLRFTCRLDAALHSETDRFRSGKRLGTVRGNARRCHRARDLFQHCACFLEGNASLGPRRLRATTWRSLL